MALAVPSQQHQALQALEEDPLYRSLTGEARKDRFAEAASLHIDQFATAVISIPLHEARRIIPAPLAPTYQGFL